MNKRSVWAAGVFFLLTVVAASAQSAHTVAKVLPTNGKNVIKLLVADNPGKSVSVKFYNAEGLIGKDDILGKQARGFIRKYDVSHVADKSFRMEVSTANASFTYDISRDGDTIIAELRETIQMFPALAAR